MREYDFYVYIMASSSGTLYIGVTNNLFRRVMEHKRGEMKGFSKKYGCTKLVYFEHYTDVEAAISREKQLKGWSRAKKEALIKKMNPHWNDLTEEL